MSRPLKKYCGTRLRRCCDTHSHAYLFDMSRRCISRALHPGVLATFFNGLLGVLSLTAGCQAGRVEVRGYVPQQG